MTETQPDAVTPRGIGWVAPILLGLGVMMVVTTAYLFVNLRDRQQSIVQSVRENAMWAVYQTHREASGLIDALQTAQAAPGPDAFAAVSLHVDLVYSRVTLLESGLYVETFQGSEALQDMANELRDSVLKFTATFDGFAGNAAALSAALPALEIDARAILKQSNGLVLATNDRLMAFRAKERAQLLGDYGQLATVVALSMILFIATIALQFKQMKTILQTQWQLKNLSDRSAESAKLAQAASDAKSLFLATMSHEIRTPLNGIIGAADLLIGAPLKPDQARNALTIRRSGHILLDVINDVLDYSNLDANGITYENAPVSLVDLADLLADVFRQRLHETELDFKIDMPPVIISSDEMRLRQVLLNLIGNAIKFTPSGVICVKASITDEQRLRIAVEDSGIGIAKEDHHKLFQNFSQIAGNGAPKIGGTGLGLAISKRIITGMGGEIGVDSELGRGSIFWFELPVDILGDAPENNCTDAQVVAQNASRFEANILLAEDNAINSEVAKALLESLGATVTIAEDGQAALARLGEYSFDFVIMDQQMPVMDGIAATRALRKLGYTLPVIGLTANAFAEDRQRSFDAGMDEFVAKPVTREKCLAILTQFGRPAREAPPPELLDFAQLNPILDDLGPALYLELLAQLAQDGQALLARATDDTDGQDDQWLDAPLHALKGAAATLGLKSVGVQAQLLRDGPVLTREPVEKLVALLDESIEAAKLAVSA